MTLIIVTVFWLIIILIISIFAIRGNPHESVKNEKDQKRLKDNFRQRMMVLGTPGEGIKYPGI